MRRAFRYVSVLAIGGGLSGCADMITGGPLIRPGEPVAAIRVVNGTGNQLQAVLISNCDASTYGLNRLPDGMAIPAGGAYDFTVSAGCWDVAGGTIGIGDARGRLRVAPGQTFTFRIY